MRRLVFILYAVVLALAVSFFLYVVSQPSKEDINAQIEEYLLSNPQILETMSLALQEEKQKEEAKRVKAALTDLADIIYDDKNNIILGNPDGDVTIVEFFDYNCPYCKQVVSHIPELINNDPNLRIIMMEFPILSQDSLEAARFSQALYMLGGNYWEFHEAMFNEDGPASKEKALKLAQRQNIDLDKLEDLAQSKEVTEIFQKNYALANALAISGTPAFIIGEEIIPGVISVEELRLRIENIRKCGKTNC